jgi:hypothetical protein
MPAEAKTPTVAVATAALAAVTA